MSTFSITINGEVYPINLTNDSSVTPDTSLATFIRTKTNYRATKVSCAEGGCGACTVALTYVPPGETVPVTRPINSCLAKLLSLNGMTVATNEYIGNKLIGYHPIQTKLAELNGTQCGYCSSGMVMLLYAYLQENPNPTPLEVEQILDGNLCRCTGYRPILDTFKSFATSTSFGEWQESLSQCRKENCCQKKDKKMKDLEDCHDGNVAPPSRIIKVTNTAKKRTVSTAAPPSYNDAVLPKATTQTIWQDCATLADVAYWLQHYSSLQVMLTVGATSLAVYPTEYDVYLNIGAAPELNVLTQSDSGVTIGAANSIKSAIDFIQTVTTANAYQTKNFTPLLAHLHRVAGYSIRCRASIGGNLMVCKQHQSPNDFFPSDVAICMLGIGATLNVLDATTNTQTSVSVEAFLAMDFTQKILVSISIPFATSQFQTFTTYKIAKRQVMAHALVNCAFQSTLSPLSGTLSAVTVAIGGVFASPTRVTAIETALSGLTVSNLTSVVAVCSQLQTILAAGVAPQGGRQAYRVQVAVNYLYKYLLSLQTSVPPALESATRNWMVRPVTTSSQTFGTDPAEYPVSMPLNKIDGLAQTAGEAQYTADIPPPFGLLHAAIVQTTEAKATISFVDSTVCNNIEGFVKYLDATSIPAAQNSFSVAPIFAGNTASYAGQCIGCVVATTRDIALKCAQLIQNTVQYTNVQTPVLSVDESIAANMAFPNTFSPVQRGNTTTGFAQSVKVVTGTVNIGSQYHIHIENNAAIVEPVEGMYKITAASQSPVNCQQIVSQALNIPASLVQVNTRRCGGGFGAKQTNSNFTASVAAIACQALQQPVSLELTLQDPLRGLGARPLYQYTYKLGVDANNKILSFQGDLALASGFAATDCAGEASTCLTNLDNCYNIPNYQVSVTMYQTNIAPGTSVRGPGWIQAITLMEMCMNGAASQLGIDSTQFRELNFYQAGNTLPTGMPLPECNLQRVWSTAKTSSNFTERQAAVATFNAANKFVKRGIAATPTRFGVDWTWPSYNATVAIYSDGSIAITHGGVEIGQGINTKVIQACAYKFGLSVDDMPIIRVLPATTRLAPNPTNVTGGSVTSELCTLTVMHCCETLNRRLAPFRSQYPTWKEAVGAAAGAYVDMLASAVSGQPQTPSYTRYNTWGTAISEVEVDGLTGQFEVIRTDLVYDCGMSLNPYIDIGQVEGGFTFGLGWFTCESVSWDPATGNANDATTWEYKPPTAYEIPETFNVTLLENSYNTSGVLSSKACGEPPVALSFSVVHALQDAINAVRTEVGDAAVPVAALPLGVDAICNQCGIATSDFVL